MEKRLFVIFIFVVSVLYGLKAQEPYFVMSYDSNDRATLYLYYDDNRVERQGTNLKWVLPFDYDRQWETNRNKDIVKVIIDPSFASYSMDNTEFWFFNCSSLEEIEGFQFLNTSNVKSVKGMFWECSSLKSLDLSCFHTDNVEEFYSLFRGCSSLTDIDVSRFNTSHAKDLNAMFEGCSSLKSLDLSSFRTDNVTGMAYMFKGCSGLTSLDLSTFRTDSLRYVSYMFEGCSNLTTITVGDEWPRNKFISATDMFLGCDSLVGGAGTRYADMGRSAANARYARIDRGETAPGYFSGEIQNDQLINSLYYNFDHENMTAEVCPMDYDWNRPDRNDYVGNIVIPEQVVYDGETYRVTSLGEYVFARCNSLTSVTIPNSVTKIGDHAFLRTTVQGSVTIPNSVTSISEEAFRECNIHNLYIDCTDITTQMFHGWAWRYSAKVNHLIIGENVKQIASDAFIHCMIENITCLAATPPYLDRMIGGLTTRWNGATVVTTNLPPLEVTRGKTFAYADAPVWSTFETIYAQQDGKRYYSIKANSRDILIDNEPGGAELCEGSEFTISVDEALDLKKCVVVYYNTDITDSLMANRQCRQTVRALPLSENMVYCDDYSAKTLDITLQKSGSLASKVNMDGLSEVEGLILHGELNGTDFLTINSMNNLCILDMADARIVSGGQPYMVETYNNEEDDEVVVEWVTENDVAGTDLLRGSRRTLRRLILPTTLCTVDSFAFEGHQKLTSLKIPSTIQTMNKGAFCMCSGLTSVSIPKGCTQIPTKAFVGCYGLKNIIIPGSIADIGEEAFSGCNSISDIWVQRVTPPSLKNNAFTDTVKERATLHVPKGHKDDYTAHVRWKKFQNIVDDIDVEAVESVPAVEGMATVKGNGIYDLQGRRVSPSTSHPSPLKKGIYIENGRKRVVSR